MKYRLLIFVLSLALSSTAQQTLLIKGNIKSLKDSTPIYIGPLSNPNTDSTMSKAGKFQFNLSIPEGDLYLIRVGKNSRLENSITVLYLQTGQVNIRGNGPLLKDIKLSGSSFIDDYNDFQNKMETGKVLKGASEVSRKYSEAYQKKDSAAIAALKPQVKEIESARMAVCQQWFDEHLQSPISSFVLYWYLRRGKSMSEIEALLTRLSPEARDNALARSTQNSVDVSRTVVIGKTAPDFTQNDTLGRPVSLKDFRGKYVLVDFWASWCVPCRAENPKVVAAFNKYKNRNFTVLGVSLDQPTGKEKWLDAIHKDGLTWSHVSDLKFWDNAVAKQFDIKSIPANLLIDPEGRIVGKDLRGEELEKKLEEVLK